MKKVNNILHTSTIFDSKIMSLCKHSTKNKEQANKLFMFLYEDKYNVEDVESLVENFDFTEINLV